MPMFNVLCDIGFTVITDDPENITTEQFITALEARLKDLKENPSEAAEAFGICDYYEENW